MRPARELADLIVSKLPLGCHYMAGFIESAIVTRDWKWQEQLAAKDAEIERLRKCIESTSSGERT